MTRSILGGLIPLAITMLAVAARPLAAPEPMKYLRHPHVANDGRIAFSYLGDLWVAGRDGANPRRITTHAARDDAPRFSPDGQLIAFTSNRMGNDDVYVVNANGGEPKQLTWLTGNDHAEYWTPDGKGIVITTSRGAEPWGSPLYVVPIDGGVPYPLPMDAGRSGMLKQDGSVVAFTRSLPSYWRRGYKGNNNADIYLQNLQSKEITQLTDPDHQKFRGAVQDMYPMWGADAKIYFVSERDSIYNIWRMDADGKNPQQVTTHRSFGVQFPSISPDGRTIIYENEFDLWTVAVPNGRPQRLAIAAEFDRVDNLVEWQTTEGRADGFTPSPTGDYVAVDFHGEIFLVPSDATLGEKTQLTGSPWRERFQSFSPNGKYVAYISDESHEEEIWLHDVATGAKRKLTNHESTKSTMTWSPNSAKVAFAAANRLFEIDVASGRTTELGFNQAGGYTLDDISSDGNWMVVTKRDDSQNAEVFLFDTRTRKETNVTQHPGGDSNGLLTPDGRHVVFTSNRNAGVNHLFVVSLTRIAEDPDDPLVRERRARATDSTRAPASGGTAAALPAQIPVDVAGIDKRAVQLTTGTNPVNSVFLSRDGRTIYYASTDTAGPGLFQVGLDGRDRRKVTTGTFGGLTPTPDRRFVFYRGGAAGGRGGGAGAAPAGSGSEIWRMTMSNQRKERVNFTFPVKVDRRGEWEQVFYESWRVMKYRFYDEKMHGIDWNQALARYAPILKHVGDNEDLYDLSNELIGQLNASHTGVSGPASRTMPRGYGTRYLGFEMEPADGRYRITHVYRNGPADKEWLNLAAGNYVLALDGKELKAGDNYWKLLTETLNDYVSVKVSAAANGADARTVRVRTVTSLTDIKYEEWVAQNREFVKEESTGRIAYVHIRSMDAPSLTRFQNEINQFWDKQGIVVDIRFNGGGNIDQELIDILERRPYQFWNSRWGSRAWGRRPRQAIAGPKVMLVNNRSGSDSEVTPLGFRDLGLGRIVGTPTSGAVIATGSYSLLNGGSVRTPGSLVVQWDPTKPNNYGINLENYGVAPDVWARNTPADELRGFDRELKAAVDEALKMLKDGKYQFGGKH